ncbi:MAG: hypothetical protein A2915_03150 [Candidatus Yanofskybacteria bacterium RIFCSPLOWO2_01_FULL_41_34]|uniref:Radical SAM core domain-containing protein n=1 Tax=Candidatus Yanofskybacteria bacterium RIFCSPHIGHO2_01_FULL_41_26 TaxID=1802661 RepID=A0A1F8EFY6_9BACT|nr:MAG: hypothetical protein A2649_01045 [Candidatus Yanofskybacteria bacterium RIFCSPHIGHO2_01_FULL_41_26]OGN21031.1 MAG: hypothetical protein A2915_03150 [Candidatus Yanofskybacteria bacterium RIFCSPLOWO2_01_FULL_41_34]
MKIGFILPSSHYLNDPFRGDPFTHLQILTILEEYFGSRVELCLPDLRGIKREFALYHIPECDVYLHSIYTLDINEQKAIVAMLRRQYPRAVHIAGGPHAVEFPQESLRIFDSLILGEGELTIIAAVNDLACNKLQQIYRQQGVIDINEYCHPNRKFLPKSTTARRKMMTLKSKPGFNDLVSTNVIFSRGCPYNCHFCALRTAREGTPGIRFRLPELIENEIEYLKREYGIQGVALVDEIALPLKRSSAIAELEAIGRADIFWRGQCRVDGITPELAGLAFQSGCISLGLGVESVWQPSLNLINKRISVQKAKDTIAMLKANGIEARIYLIMGLPGEPDNIVELTLNFIKETQPDLIYLSLFTIRPGTEVFRNPDKFGIRNIETDWENTMHIHNLDNKKPRLTFQYHENASWGKTLTNEQIVNNYLELVAFIKEAGLSASELNRNTFPFDDINPLA